VKKDNSTMDIEEGEKSEKNIDEEKMD